MTKIKAAVAGCALAGTVAAAQTAHAAPVYVALGDSITFGETNLAYVQSYGDRGYVGLYADSLAARDGVRPTVVNLAIDGETATSFFSDSGRTPPVTGRGDAPLQLENLNYGDSTAISQATRLAQVAAQQTSLGNTIADVSITLGFNELAALAPASNTPALEAAALAKVPAELAAYKADYSKVLADVRAEAPTGKLDVLGYYDPFPADPSSPAAPLFDTYGKALNGIIAGLAAEYGATYVNTAPPFIGNEAADTYEGVQPAGSSIAGPFGGVLPIGNVHPNAAGYALIAEQVESVPEPSSVAALASGLALLGLAARRVPARARRRG